MDDNQNKKCPSCGSEQPENAAFCGECGSKMSEVQEQNPDSLAPPVKDNSSTDNTTTQRDDFQQNQRQYQQQYQPQMYSQYEMNPLDAPLSLGDYLLMIIAFGVPIIGLILMIVWSVSSSTNTNRKNFSRAMLILYVIGFIIGIILSVAFAALIYSVFQEISREYGNGSQFFYGFDMSIFTRFLPW